ncbi:DUF1127 domain-containing protein [Tropicibacter sp. S64]|uniref:DUF1127 domain-containing protein n=1 Tax=Tropicibacter sp. S64 TaxID=3415122 RepID=UPI003C7E35B8
MAYASDVTRAPSALGSLLSTLTVDIRARLARRKVFNTTYRELASLSDRELSDLGLNRTMVRRVAYQAAYEM